MGETGKQRKFPLVVWQGSSLRIVLTSHYDAVVEEREGSDALGAERWVSVRTVCGIRRPETRPARPGETLKDDTFKGVDFHEEFVKCELVKGLVCEAEERAFWRERAEIAEAQLEYNRQSQLDWPC